MSYDPYQQSGRPPQAGWQQAGRWSAEQPPAGGSQNACAYGPPMAMPVEPKVNGTANWSLWWGILGLVGGIVCQLLAFFLPYVGWFFIVVTMVLWFAPILAVVFGVKGLRQVKQRRERGTGRATAGLVLGTVGIIMALLYLILLIMFAGAALAFFGLVGAFN